MQCGLSGPPRVGCKGVNAIICFREKKRIMSLCPKISIFFDYFYFRVDSFIGHLGMICLTVRAVRCIKPFLILVYLFVCLFVFIRLREIEFTFNFINLTYIFGLFVFVCVLFSCLFL